MYLQRVLLDMRIDLTLDKFIIPKRKVWNMKNFIFKSKVNTSDLFKISLKLEAIQREQRHQRSDLAEILVCVHSIENVPRQEDTEHIPEEET